jgi:hypothetical protein
MPLMLKTKISGGGMRFSKNLWMGFAATIMAFAFVPASHAQLNSGASTVNLNAPLAESLTVSAGPATVTFALPPTGSAPGSAPVTITTTWALAKTRTSVKLFAYFATGNALTDGAGDNIPVANVSGSINGAPATAFTGATPFGGATGMTVFTQAITLLAGPFNASHGPDTIGLAITTTGLSLPAATYTGVLNIQAQAI